uniref:protein-serine/threonine phosphatase n=1 Tax=Kalanchoe fedtschenkoi TaxID=63787 RepID=A0A7N0TZ12_KALFE
MGSCFSAESRNSLPLSPSSTSMGIKKRKATRKKMGARNSSFEYKNEDYLHRIPNRLFLNGSTQLASLFTQQGKKGTNQDAMIVWENFGSRAGTVFCGVFDGHGPFGHMVAKRVRDALPLKLSAHWEASSKCGADVLREISLNTAGSTVSEDVVSISADDESRLPLLDTEDTGSHIELFEILKESFLKSFRVMDRELKMHTNIDCFCSGTTAVTLVKQGQSLVIGNVGDSRAVLGTRDADDSLIAVQLTVDLKPNLPAESERIQRCRGRVFSLKDEPDVARVWLPNHDSPGLAMARAFGDFCLKDFGLISVPEVSHRRLTDKDEFVVLATDGIWDVLSNKEVVDIVATAPGRSSAARTLVESAVMAWRYKYPTSKVDDCAAVCLFFDKNSEEDTPVFANNKSRDPVSSEQLDTTAVEEDSSSSGPGMLARSGTVRTPQDTIDEDVTDHLTSETKLDWSSLEGVSRKNTLKAMPELIPEEDENGKAGGNTNI